VAPGPGYVWASGYWRWTGADYVWVPGSWIVRPRQPQFGSRATGCIGPAAGSGLQAIGSKKQTVSDQSSELNDCQVATTAEHHQPRILAKMSGATIVASDSMMNFGVSMFSFPHVIFSLGTAPEYDPKLVVESLI
jgi:hypothetical protein